MKNIIAITFVGLFLIGCAGSKSGTSEDMKMGKDVPKWAGGQTAEDAFYGVGFAKKQNPALAKKAAAARARTEISEAVKIQVSSMLKDFMQESGIGESAQALEFTESVTKQVTSNSLSGSVIEDTYFSNDGSVWVLVSYSLDNTRKSAANAASKEEALYNEFKASQAFNEMNSSIQGSE
ncbi:uncharacterized protein METZ01_LOCUS366144 [marine metagenome]|uniref:Lipoprotein LPP20-like domain-containing protein n=1 Tax=marine metagenome TaxID=408172 RepID=A0A382STR0_9ZZZZ